MTLYFVCFLFVFISGTVNGQHNPHFFEGRSGIVHLFEWKFLDVALECERFFSVKKYGGVQLSPVNENIIIPNRPWWERYQPISYILTTRSGNAQEFVNMTTRCNNVGVRVYVDVVFNHMTADSPSVIGTAGSTADPVHRNYPAVPYSVYDFHPTCEIHDYNDPVQVRNCELVGLHDLNQTVPWVQDRIIDFLNDLVSKGVAGFRVDAAKHMWPNDLKQMYERINSLNSSFRFNKGARPFIYQEVIDISGEGVSKFEYNQLGAVTEFGFSDGVGRGFGGKMDLIYLKTMNSNWGLLPTKSALIFVDNHDNQRGNDNILTYKNPRAYKMATAFMLSYPFGIPRVMSSYFFEDFNQGPPADADGNLISPGINPDNTCSNGYVCEHRWRQIYNMIEFKNTVKNVPIKHWWDNGKNQIAYARYQKGFIAFNKEQSVMHQTLQTSLPAGCYCDIISGTLVSNNCTGKQLFVNAAGETTVQIASTDEDGVVAIHINSRVS
ncbi:unnamed protein product [Sphagnum compactum]